MALTVPDAPLPDPIGIVALAVLVAPGMGRPTELNRSSMWSVRAAGPVASCAVDDLVSLLESKNATGLYLAVRSGAVPIADEFHVNVL